MHASTLIKKPSLASSSSGVTLIELMVTLLVLAVLLGIGVPSFTDFMADQRVRVAASDFIGDFSLARAKALETSQRTIMVPAIGGGACGSVGPFGSGWSQGWCIFVDANNNGSFNAGEQVLRINNGYGGRISICPNPNAATGSADFTNGITLRPDGRIVRNLTNVSTNDGITISDDLGDGRNANDKIRTVLIGITGRPSLVIQNGQTNGGRAC